MNKLSAIYTEKNNCQDCYKCVKNCPVKAIKLEDNSASVIPELCIYCGKCTQVCPANAKKVRDDLPVVRQALKKEKIIVSLAPSYLSEYENVETNKVIAAFKEAGFYGVSETALGAEKVALETKNWIDKQENGVYISSCCPSAVLLINKYYSEHSSAVAPILSPMVAHAKFLKEIYPEAKVLFVGPCIAKKEEVTQYAEYIDYVLSFKDIKAFFEDIGIFFEFMKPTEDDVFIPIRANKGNLYPIDGGMLTCMIDSINSDVDRINHNSNKKESIRYMTFSGVKNLKEIMRDFDSMKTNGKTFIEVMTCDGGCIKGPETISKKSSASKRLNVLDKVSVEPRNEEMLSKLNELDISTKYDFIKKIEKEEYSLNQIYEALKMVNKKSEADELNCGGCGYDNCREFAKALIAGKAENDMCISYMRKIAQDKTNILLKKMPSGIVIVNDKLKVVDANKNFADILGDEVKMIFEANPGLYGADITKLIPYHNLFSQVLETGVDIIEQDIRDGERYYTLSVFSVQNHSLVCGIIKNLHAPEVRKDLVLNRTKEVIMENMKVVQQIAFLLGENASFTESMLNSILESHSEKDSQKTDN
ncbi:MAG: [Fe-Fe] hydrogenase large subunit C-terminal domain-containing protein [Bacteroidales bacterium]|nr:[Fe-Fe] hydrogenase large subunit C-terminal domain-containing protein [Bacteroidales bacterium]